MVAYSAYLSASDHKSLVTGAPLPGWVEQDERIRDAWRAAARAVIPEPDVTGKLSDECGRLTAENKRLKAELDALTAQLADAETEVSQLEDLPVRIEGLKAAITELADQADAAAKRYEDAGRAAGVPHAWERAANNQRATAADLRKLVTP
jgi:chromosome segregation ATPase